MKQSMKLTEAEILEVLQAIELRTIQLLPDHVIHPNDSGNILYTTSTGWKLVVFNDVGCWDYLDSMQAPDGRRATFEDIQGMPGVRNYTPSAEVEEEVYLIR
jgi:hypothetical protein